MGVAGRAADRKGSGLRYLAQIRALAVKLDDDYVWFWIGEHDIYEARI
jgi:hypothetical protein